LRGVDPQNLTKACARDRDHESASYGVVWSAHVELLPACGLELTFAKEAWASIDPVESGTFRVVKDAFSALLDKDGAFARLQRAVAMLRPVD